MSRYYTRDRFAIWTPTIPDNLKGTHRIETAHGTAEIVRVGCGSSRSLRNAAEQIAVQFQREFRYDCIQYLASEDPEFDEDHTPIVMFAEDTRDNGTITISRDGKIRDRLRVLGAVCVRWRVWSDHPPGYALAWVWMHPYRRRAGYLRGAWPLLREWYGQFEVEPPLSPAMKSFLANVEPCAVSADGVIRWSWDDGITVL